MMKGEKMAKSNKRIVYGLILSCWLVYTLSMCLKMAYSASMAEIKDEYGVNNVTASLPLTLYYVFYAIIQFSLALFMTKINLKLYMGITFTVSGLSFISIFFYSPVWYIGSVLVVNGITLGAVWCGSVLIFAKYLSPSVMNKALLFMGAGFSVGSAMSFAISSLAISLGNWRISFLIFGIAFLLSTFYMLYAVIRAEKAGLQPDEESVSVKKQTYKATKISAKPLLIMAIIAVFFASILYYGFTNWMPTILKNNFGIANAKATLITTLFPIVVYLGPVLSAVLVDKVKNDFAISVATAVAISVVGLVLCYVFRLNIVLTVAVILVLGIMLRLVNNLFACLIPLHIKDYINAGKTSAVVNASACASAAISPFLIAFILDESGNDWKLLFFVLFGFSLVMLAICCVFLIADGVKRKKTKIINNVD